MADFELLQSQRWQSVKFVEKSVRSVQEPVHEWLPNIQPGEAHKARKAPSGICTAGAYA